MEAVWYESDTLKQGGRVTCVCMYIPQIFSSAILKRLSYVAIYGVPSVLTVFEEVFDNIC